ncbi:AlpA family phage regulatory protein [Psychromonas sp. SP041]|jgi:prophage regulatory protein|uniref:helix-turn-helix transcriptional regulator n=1 Tax=Psychromonas sp. SP041 TaxID=1365007 RepID=UPI000560B449|nr:AlpA family phage regulatory protein [Psychromonas sp. SP041]
MEPIQKIKILRLKDACNMFGISRSCFYKRIEIGIYPPPISLGDRAVGWVESELQTILRGLVSGKNHDVLKSIVCDLIEQRQLLI